LAEAASSNQIGIRLISSPEQGRVRFMIANATQELPMNLFFKSAVVGTVAAIAVGVLAFASGPFFDGLGAYVKPAGLLLPVIGRVIPSKMVDWLAPNGGAAAGVLLILVCAILFWTVALGTAYFASTKLK
jgi:hypothetical protein